MLRKTIVDDSASTAPLRAGGFVLRWVALAAYVTLFWGRFGEWWPVWLQGWSGWVCARCWDVLRAWAAPADALRSWYLWMWLAVSVVLGLALPLGVWRLCGRTWREAGLGRPNALGWRYLALGLVVVLVFVVPLAREVAGSSRTGVARAERSITYVLVMSGVTLPEHVLLTGLAVAVLLPGGVLPVSRSAAPAEMGGRRRWLRWIGLAESDGLPLPLYRRVPAWFGLDGAALAAVVGAGLLFGIVHVGKGPMELATSFPGGCLLCYVTYRSRSIWPGWAIHMAQMVGVALVALW